MTEVIDDSARRTVEDTLHGALGVALRDTARTARPATGEVDGGARPENNLVTGGAHAAPVLTDPTGARRRSRRTRILPAWTRRLTGPAVLLVVWLAVTGLDLVSDRALASPGEVFGAGRELWGTGELASNLGASLYRVAWGCGIGIAIGLALAVVAGFFRFGEDVVDSAMNFLRTIPVIALLPLIIVWIGIGEEAKIFLISVGVLFPVYMNTFAAIRGVDMKLVEAGRAFGLGRLG
ncbi:ABC transporter permease, partial [Frankia sp. EI5c]|uniref:ABC transporter permease n=1 Tax=Frankia sp. EI5c TaxID=683316 RepID=UPI0037C120F0